MSRELTASDAQSRDHLRAVLSIEPHPETNCAVLASGTRGEDVSQDIICPNGDCERGSQCRSEVTNPDTGTKQFISGTVHDRCICPVFRSHDCIASIDRFDQGALAVELSVPNRSELEGIVNALRETGATVQLLRIAPPSSDGDDRSIEIEIAGITTKQREAVLVAVEKGYYETPRRTDLGELADTLGVSKSAVSQRLSAVESNLIMSLYDRESESGSNR